MDTQNKLLVAKHGDGEWATWMKRSKNTSYKVSHADTVMGTIANDACWVAQSCPTLCQGLQPSRLLCPWDSPEKNTGVGCHSLLHAIFLTQGSNLDLLHCGQIVYHLRLGRNFLISGKALISISHLKRLGLKIATSSKPEGLSRGCCFVLCLWGVELGLGGTYVCPSLDHKQSWLTEGWLVCPHTKLITLYCIFESC